MVFRHRMGWVLTLAIIPVLLTGLGCMGQGIYLEFYSTEKLKPGATWALMVFGLGIALGALAGITMVWDILLDRANGVATRRRGFLGRIKVVTFPLETFAQVVIWPTRVKGHRRYHVELWGAQSLYLTEYSSEQQAVEKAKEVGEYTGLPVKNLGSEQ